MEDETKQKFGTGVRLPMPTFIRDVKIVDGLAYPETDESFRRRIKGEPGEIEYRDTPE